jgi:hypothetical protein
MISFLRLTVSKAFICQQVGADGSSLACAASSKTKALRCSPTRKQAIQVAMAIKGPTTDRHEIRAWADSQGNVPANVEPNRIDAEPASMSLLHKKTIEETAFVKEMSWEDFFARFECLKLTLVHDDSTVFNEILQVDDETGPPLAYRTVTSHH